MASIQFEEFSWFVSKPKTQMTITIPNQKNINLNPKLMEQMPTYIAIGAKDGGKSLAIRATDESGWRLPKSGSLKKEDYIGWLIAMGVKIPARFSVTREENGWLAVMDELEPPKVNMKKPPRKPRADALRSLAREAKAHE